MYENKFKDFYEFVLDLNRNNKKKERILNSEENRYYIVEIYNSIHFFLETHLDQQNEWKINKDEKGG